MKYNYANIKIACQSGVVTTLVCLSLPSASFASDTELYKAPQTSETTIMFMLDVSGSMGDSNSYDGTTQTRLQRLKSGLLKLLQGDANEGVERLPDNLSTGLSDFAGTTGRIRLEALPLNTTVTLNGNRQIYRQIEQLNQPMSCTTTATQDTITPQERTRSRTYVQKRTRTQTRAEAREQTREQTAAQTRTRTKTRSSTNNPWPTNWGAWNSWSPNNSSLSWSNPSWSSWSAWEATGNWSNWTGFGDWSRVQNWSSWTGWGSVTNAGAATTGAWTGGGACSAFTTNGAATVKSTVIQECTEWQTNNTTCANWEVSTKTAAQITGTPAATLATGTTTGAATQQGAAQNAALPTVTWTPASATDSNPTPTSALTYNSTFAETDGTASSTTTTGATDSDPFPTTAATDSNPTPVLTTSSNNRTQTQTQTINNSRIQTKTETRTETNAETQNETNTQTQTQTSNTITGRQTRTDTTSATRADTRTTIYTGTATGTHRQRMVERVNALTSGGSTPTAYAYAEVAAYMMGQTTKDLISSGFSVSNGNAAIQDGNQYIAPDRVTSAKQCNTQGIYFLTDGEPNQDNINDDNFMKETLGSKKSSFNCTGSLFNSNQPWNCIGNYARALLDPTKNPSGVKIQTAVVGFGRDFGDGQVGNSNVENAKKWGTVGQGGWYSGASALDVVDSVKAFLKKLEKYIPPVTTGSITIPTDALDTQNVQPWAYYQQFDPRPADVAAVTWFGNVKKYKTLNNSLVDRDNASIMNNGLLKDNINDYWADTNVKKEITKLVNDVDTTSVVNVGGALSQMILGYDNNRTPKERRIFTDRNIVVDPNDSDNNIIDTITSGDLNQIGKADFLSTSTNKFKEDPKRGYLLSLFGYEINSNLVNSINAFPQDSTYQTQLDNLLAASVPQRDWLMGAVMHSKPIMLTQEGKTSYNNTTGVLTYENRDDLILFGTTQGVLHVVRAGKTESDTDGGKEVFAFVPSEMLNSQPQAFLPKTAQDGSLAYGVDGQWTAYTEYVTKKTSNPKQPTVTVNGGKQLVYGGLRMGGKSYYGLDLTNISSSNTTSKPKIKFRIDPANATSGGLSYMGQSWSKPEITWVNWKGSRKLVMFVGGGYDMGYEDDTYNQTNGVGAGVYMFDANNGDLLWWASSNASTTNTGTTNQALNVSTMKYSVVSRIKSIDANSDGLADYLYFGDLGGQLWRIDLDTKLTSTSTTAFAKRAVRVLNLSRTDGKAARFYTTPTFTIHNGGSAGLFGVLSIGSGNLSLPMSTTNNGNDGIYVLYDKDITKPNLAQIADSALITKDITLGTSGETLASNSDGKTKTDLTRAGWYYPFASTTKYRVLNDAIAIDNDLYVSVFDASKEPDNVLCTGGVRGESNVNQFCLPYGQCTETVNNAPVVKSPPAAMFLGKGNIGISFGGVDGKPTDRTLIFNVPKPTGTGVNVTNYAGKLKFVSQRWYEKYAK